MTLAVYALSGLLVLVGVILIFMGAPVVHLEQGWTEIISGSVLIASGCITAVLGLVIARLDAMLVAIASLPTVGVSQAPVVMPDLPVVPDDAAVIEPVEPPAPESMPASSSSVQPEPALAAFEAPVPLEEPENAVAPSPRELAPLEVAPLEPVPVEATAIEPVASPVEVVGVAPTPISAPERAVERPEPVAAVRKPDEAAAAGLDDARRKRPNFLSAFLARRMAAAEAQAAREPPRSTEPSIEPTLRPFDGERPRVPERTSIDVSSGWPEPEPLVAEPAAPDPVEPRNEHAAAPEPVWDEAPLSTTEPPEEEPGRTSAESETAAEGTTPGAHPLRPTIVGRYNAGSASYLMYSNGMIEVETETGVHQFGSMQELKAFIERQDPARV